MLSLSFWLAFALVFFVLRACADIGLSSVSGVRLRRVRVAHRRGRTVEPATAAAPCALDRAA